MAQYDSKIEYKLDTLNGKPLTLDYTIGLRTDPYPRDEERLQLNGKKPLQEIANLTTREKLERVNWHVHNVIAIAGLDFKVDTYLKGNTVNIYGEPDNIKNLAALLKKDGLLFIPTAEVKREVKISRDARSFIQNRIKGAERLVFKASRTILGLAEADNNYNWGLHQGQPYMQLMSLSTDHLENLQAEVEEFRYSGAENAPPRFHSDHKEGVINLAKMNVAENNAYEQASSTAFTLKNVLESLVFLRETGTNAGISSSLEYKWAVEQLNIKYDKEDGIIPEDAKPQSFMDNDETRLAQEKKSFASAASNLLSRFMFETKDHLRQWHHINPFNLLPIYSFGLLASFSYIELHPLFDTSTYKYSNFEATMFFILRELVNRDFQMDSLTRDALSHIAKIDQFHNIIRLTAFGMLEKSYGFKQAQSLTGISKSEWIELYQNSAERVISKPSVFTTVLIPHLQGENIDLTMTPYLKVIDKVRESLKVSKLNYPKQMTRKNLQKEAELSEGEKAFRRIKERNAMPSALSCVKALSGK